MSTPYQELEVKFYIADLPALETRVQSLGGNLVQARQHEVNLRMDTAGGDLARTFQVLRLRQDANARVTYKGPAQDLGGAQLRREIEFVVSDFAATQALFEALGYQVSLMYEKYRTVYELPGMVIVLDEMPYGNFAEIEAGEPDVIQQTSHSLGLDWEARIQESYVALFRRLKSTRGLMFRDLSFANFQKLATTPYDLGVLAADASSATE